MRLNRIARAWTQIAAKLPLSRGFTPEARSNHPDAIRVAPSAGDFYKEPGTIPYRAENRRERSDFSQHLSC